MKRVPASPPSPALPSRGEGAGGFLVRIAAHGAVCAVVFSPREPPVLCGDSATKRSFAPRKKESSNASNPLRDRRFCGLAAQAIFTRA